jgi:peptidoglycan/LPS O-acetylase OafA/YrhL
MYAVPAVCLLFGLAISPTNPVSRILSVKPVVFLGEASYAFYLIHTIVLSLVVSGTWAKVMNADEVLVEVENLGFALILAVGVHVAVERPARVWLRHVLVRSSRPAHAR